MHRVVGEAAACEIRATVCKMEMRVLRPTAPSNKHLWISSAERRVKRLHNPNKNSVRTRTELTGVQSSVPIDQDGYDTLCMGQ